MRKIDTIIVHHSDSSFGTAALLRQWQMLPPQHFKDIAYHYVILNGVPESKSPYSINLDGLVEKGREDDIIGAHARGHNTTSLGICLIGKTKFTPRQSEALRALIMSLICMYPKIKKICGHRDVMPTECPTFDVAEWWASGRTVI